MNENLEEYKKQLLKRSKELKETSKELDEYKQELVRKSEELSKREKYLDEEFELRKQAIELESKEIRMEYQREFNLVVEQEVKRRLEQRKPHGPRPLEDVSPRSPLKERNRPRVTDALEGFI